MAEECLNCCDEIEEGKEIRDDEGNSFCCEKHMRWYNDED